MKHLTQEQIDQLQSRLEEERAKLVEELNSLGAPDPTNPQDWNPIDSDALGTRDPDLNSRADHFEEMDTNSAISEDLEGRLRNVDQALAKIAEGTYGLTEEGEEIPLERLQANPAATTLVS